MGIKSGLNRKQFAAAVVKQLEKHEISCVLVGGSCVSIYTNERHHSKDLDFISPYSHEAIRKALAEIGFESEGRYFTHPKSKFYVEFPSGPPAIGKQVPVKSEGKLQVRNVTIKMYSPTQSVMDRLAAWFHWNDRRSLVHALWICEKHPINLDKLKRWASKEGEPDKLQQFLSEYAKVRK